MGGKPRLTLDIFIKESQIKHNNEYTYGNTVYVRGKDKLTVTCKKHGDFSIRGDAHRINGQGCPSCRRSRASRTKINKTSLTILDCFKKVHGDTYGYDDFVYNGDRVLSTITCRYHGNFKQAPSAHKIGKGCLKCARQNQNYRRSKYIESCNKKYKGKSNLYLLKIKDINNTVFYKIGITVQDIKCRYSKSKMPYEYEVIKMVNADARSVFDTELNIKSELSKKRYTPMLKMPGSKYECFSEIPKYIDDLIDSLVDCSNERIDI